MKTMSAADFIEHAADVLDEIRANREEIVVTSDGEMIARLMPAAEAVPTLENMRGMMKIVGDIVAPLDEEWDANR